MTCFRVDYLQNRYLYLFFCLYIYRVFAGLFLKLSDLELSVCGVFAHVFTIWCNNVRICGWDYENLMGSPDLRECMQLPVLFGCDLCGWCVCVCVVVLERVIVMLHISTKVSCIDGFMWGYDDEDDSGSEKFRFWFFCFLFVFVLFLFLDLWLVY